MQPFHCVLLFIIMIFSGPSTIHQVAVETKNWNYAGTDDPVYMKICNSENHCCETQLRSENTNRDDFEAGNKDIFTSNFGACSNLPIVGVANTVTLRHVGTDGWRGDRINIRLRDERKIHCWITSWIDNDGSTTPFCRTLRSTDRSGLDMFDPDNRDNQNYRPPSTTPHPSG